MAHFCVEVCVLITQLQKMAESASSKRGKYSSKSVRQKYEALKLLEKGRAKKNVAAQFKVPPNTISTWLKNKEKIVRAFEGGSHQTQLRLKVSTHDNLDKALYKWFVRMRDQGVPIDGPLFKEKTRKYAEELGIQDFKAFNGWFDRWKNRHSVTFKTVLGEAKSCTADMTASWLGTTLPTLVTNYKLRDIYNADEFGLFYKALPSRSLQLIGEKCVGGKHSKECITGLAAANAEGEKLPMFVIGKAFNPRCF